MAGSASVHLRPSSLMNLPPFCHPYRYSQLLPKLGMNPHRVRRPPSSNSDSFFAYSRSCFQVRGGMA